MKYLWLALLGMTFVGQVSARSFGPAGCGLGQIMFEGKEGLVFNVLAGTFNGSSGNQTFGMSTGTLGCESAKTAKVTSAAFIEGNRVALSNDVARGQGEALASYLSIIKKTNADVSILRRNYAHIFAAKNSAKDIDQKIQALL